MSSSLSTQDSSFFFFTQPLEPLFSGIPLTSTLTLFSRCAFLPTYRAPCPSYSSSSVLFSPLFFTFMSIPFFRTIRGAISLLPRPSSSDIAHPAAQGSPAPTLSFSALHLSVPPSNPLLTLQFSTFAVEFSPLLSQVSAHADGMGRRFKPAANIERFKKLGRRPKHTIQQETTEQY